MPKGKKKNEPKQQLQKPQQKEQKVEEENQTDHNPGSSDNQRTGRQDEDRTICDREKAVYAGQDCYCKPGN